MQSALAETSSQQHAGSSGRAGSPILELKPGQRFGRLTVISRVISGRSKHWLCRCECGRERSLEVHYVVRGKIRSCGCLGGETHGHARHGAHTRTYRSWASMIQRCTNPKATGFRYYGGRGITVCESWNSFANFLADMGDRPIGKTLDRMDNDGNYEPGNCRWATRLQQNRNQRPRKAA